MTQTLQNQVWLKLLERYGALEVAKKIDELPSYQSYRAKYVVRSFHKTHLGGRT